jgi:hypothetical protein
MRRENHHLIELSSACRGLPWSAVKSSDLPKPELVPPAELLDGPFHEPAPTGKYDKYFMPLGAGVIRIPVDNDFQFTEGEPFAFTRYWGICETGHPGPVSHFSFHGYLKADGQQFPVKFVDGPAAGVRYRDQPTVTTPLVLIALPSEPGDDDKTRRKVLAEYKNINGLMHYVKTERVLTDELRIVVNLSGGALDGRCFDTDDSQDQDGNMSARVICHNTECRVGAQFSAPLPRWLRELEEVGPTDYRSAAYRIERREDGPREVRLFAVAVAAESPPAV